jgi:chromosome segregation ATPase
VKDPTSQTILNELLATVRQVSSEMTGLVATVNLNSVHAKEVVDQLRRDMEDTRAGVLKHSAQITETGLKVNSVEKDLEQVKSQVNDINGRLDTVTETLADVSQRISKLSKDMEVYFKESRIKMAVLWGGLGIAGSLLVTKLIHEVFTK